MMESSQKYLRVIKMSYGFFADQICTADTLGQFLEMVQKQLDEAGVSREDAYSDLERRHTIAMLDSSSILEDYGDHIDWFNLSTNNGLSRHIVWHFWSHFEDYMTAGKNWSKGVVESVDRESSNILSRLEDPLRSGSWDRRGMVMGSVQSGKTANYTGLICKAIDAGYRLIVVLAGVHNSLRSQTQYRLNEEVMGYDLDKVQEFDGQAARIGVRAMFTDHRIAQTLTSSNERGDFKKPIAEQAGIIPSQDGSPIVMIIKKHVSILKNLIDWATSIIGEPDDSGRRIVTDVPLLVIDDESDYASVNTRKVVFDEDGNVDAECDPAKTNQRIRELLSAFRKSAYIGYTATPFANIFIHHDMWHPTYGEDLFPRNFILSLPRPENYIGPEQIFGLEEHLTAGIAEKDPSRLLKYVEDSDEAIPAKHNKNLEVNRLPTSLEEAIRAFLLSCAVRKLRHSSPPHNSMIIHVTRFTWVQERIHFLVEQSLRRYVDRIRSKSDRLEDFREMWEKDFVPISTSMEDEVGIEAHAWKEIVENLYPVAGRIRILRINGTSEDSLSYRHAEMAARQRTERGEDVPWEERGEHVIAIGGDKLSRGLTLDGLTVSYYLRAAKMYDTLMQMGRWFGYRDGYMDVCRIYTTHELADWYRFIASASMELRQELDYMALINAEPKEFGLKVLDFPGQLAITSAGKRRNAEMLDLSYSGRISETVVFDLHHSSNNLKGLISLLKILKNEGNPGLTAIDGKLHWKDISPEIILRYLHSYKTQDEAARVVDPAKIALFIEQQLSQDTGDLTTWDVVIVTRRESPNHTFTIDGHTIGCLERKPLTLTRDNLTIRRLVNPSDEWLDFSKTEKQNAWELWAEQLDAKGRERPPRDKLPTGPAIRATRSKERGVLLIYPICYSTQSDNIHEPDIRYGLVPSKEVIGFAISFPASDTTRQVRYQVNSVFQDAED